MAVNSSDTTYGDDLTFDTSKAAPTVSTGAVTGVTAIGATLNGTVNAQNDSTTITFEYGLTSAYDKTVIPTPDATSGTSDTAVSADIRGLTPNTLYHFRLDATNSGGTTLGSDETFTSSNPLDDFVITVKTDNPGNSSSSQFTNPTDPSSAYNYNVDCDNDGINEVTGQTGDYLTLSQRERGLFR